MNGAAVIAEILKHEGTEFLSCYPRNPLIEASAALDIRPILCRQERVGVGIADGYSRVKRGKRNGVFAAQAGPASRTPSRALRRPFQRMSRCWLSPAACRSSGNMCGRFSAPPVFFGR
jgi:acetolactate synthase I/II/III large subunit